MMISKVGSKNGFVFIEVCIVVVLILVLVSISWPVLKTMSEDLILRLSTNRIIALLDNAREKAILESKYYILEFDTFSNKFFLKTLDENSNSDDALETVKQDYIIRDDLKNRLQIESVSVNKLVFKPDGTSEDFSLVLEDKQERLIINVEGLTGKCKLEKLKKS